MAHHVEPMDIDSMDSDFDNKENTFHHSNVLPCTEKGYEELDVSELNMRLRYSITPASSPMSKSYTAHCHDNRNTDVSDDSLNTTVTDNLTRSLNSTMNKNDSVIKSLKTLPLQMLATDNTTDSNRNVSVLRQLDSTITADDNANVTVTTYDENLSLPSSSSSTLHTPEATTPTKDMSKDGGSPIMRGLKSVLNMFRSSQSPVSPEIDNANKQEDHNPEITSPKLDHEEDNSSQILIASTPIAAHRNWDTVSKRSSPYKDSIVFNDDLEKELQWKDETTIPLSQEKVQKLHFQQTKSISPDYKSNINMTSNIEKEQKQDSLNNTVEYMDISYNDSNIINRTMTEIQINKHELTATESDSEFLDCETTFTKNDSQNLNVGEIENVAIPNVFVTQNVTASNSVLDGLANLTEIKDTIGEPKQPLEIPNQSYTITGIEEPENTMSIQCPLGVTNQDKMHTIANEDVITTDSQDQQRKDQDQTYCNELTLPVSSEPILPEPLQEGQKEIAVDNQAENNVKKHNDDELINLNNELEPDSFEYNKINAITDVPSGFETSAKPLIVTTDVSPEKLLNTVQDSIELTDVNATLCEIPKTEIPADVPLPEEDDIEKELDMTIDGLAKNSVDLSQDLPQVGNIEYSSNSLNLLHEKLEKSLLDVLSDKTTENIEDKLLNITTELSNEQEYTNQIEQNMSLDSIQLLNDIKNFVECDSSASAKFAEQLETELNVLQNMNIDESIQTLSGVQNEIIVSSSENVKKNEVEDVEIKTQSHSSFDNIETTKIVCDILIEHDDDSVANILKTTEISSIDEKNLDHVSKVNVLLQNEIETTEVIEALTEENFSVPKTIEVDNVESKNKPISENNTEEKIIDENNSNPNLEIKDLTDVERFCEVPNTVTLNDNVVIQNEIQVNDIIPSKPCTENETDKVVINVDEVTVSGDTSPFVSMSTGINSTEPKLELNLEDIVNSLVPEANAPPTSPAIVSKGYNFNFDEMDDPFATKTNIRMTPPPNTPNKIDLKVEVADKIFEPPKRDINKNRRKSHTERKKLALSTKKFNATFDGVEKEPIKKDNLSQAKIDKIVNEDMDIDSIKCQGVDNKSIVEVNDYKLDKSEIQKIDNPKIIDDKVNDITDTKNDKSEYENIEKHVDSTFSVENISYTESKTIVENEIKNTSSSEQSTYYSVGTSSNESIPSKNVFNLPEIDDMNFNPFATKCKMRQSPLPNIEMGDPFATKSNMKFTPDSSTIDYGNVRDHDINTTIVLNEAEKSVPPYTDKMETENMEKETSGNISNTTCSSKATDDIDTTVREVHTEDEDTEEGPFLEPDDFNNLDKMSDFDGENVDMMQLNDFPTQCNDGNLTGEMFIDAEAFEFLLNQNKSNVVADSGKESLFLKFDPLFAKRMSSDGFLAASTKVKSRQQAIPTTVTKPPELNMIFEKSPIAGPSNLNITYEEDASKITDESSEDLNVTVSKPMMIVTPAFNPVVTPRNKSLTPTRSNRHSITFTSPAMAVIDRLISMSANNSLVSHDTTITHATREQNEADLALTQLRELLAEKEIHVYNLRSESNEMKDRLMTLESQMKTLESESQQRLTNINELNGRLSEKTKVNRSMAVVVEEYERTIASLIAEIEQDKKQHADERMQLIKERDESTAHLASMEVSFSDLHSKYEKSKQIILNYKANEDKYKKSIKECEENFDKMHKNYEQLKQHATIKLNHANQEMEKTNRVHEAEVLKLNAMIKRKDLHITSLEETLTQKTKANEELAAICDELINKVA